MSELGNLLQQARKKQGLTLDDIQERTKIQKRYLQAIEEGRYEVLPGKFYIRAFVKSYAEVLGLPISQLFEEYAEELEIETEGAQIEYVPPARKSRFLSFEGKWIPRFLVILLFIIVGGVIYYYADLSQLTGRTEPPTTADPSIEQDSFAYHNYREAQGEAENENVSPEPKPVEPVAPPITVQLVKEDGSHYYFEVEGTDQLEVVMKPTERNVWMAIREGENGRTIHDSFTAKQNESYTFTFSQGSDAYFHLGNAKNIEVTVNGVTVETATMPISVTYWHFQLVPEEAGSIS